MVRRGSNNHAAQEHCAVNVVFNDTNPDPDIDNSHTDFHANTGQRGAVAARAAPSSSAASR